MKTPKLSYELAGNAIRGMVQAFNAVLFTALLTCTEVFSQSVLLDPGHGGEHPGAVGACGIVEKFFVLDISNEAYSRISSDPRLYNRAPFTTRHTDATVGINARWMMANNTSENARDSHDNPIPQGGVGLFVSIHANAFSDPTAHGTEVLYYESNDERSRGSKNVAVLALQQHIYQTLPVFVAASSRGIVAALEDSVGVLQYTIMPAVLIETEFITNPTNCPFFTQGYQFGAAEGIKEVSFFTSDYAQGHVELELVGNLNEFHAVLYGGAAVARNVTPRQTIEYFVNGPNGQIYMAEGISLMVIDDFVRVKARNGGIIHLNEHRQGYPITTLIGESGGILAGSGGTVHDEAEVGVMSFLGHGSVIGIDGGTYILGLNVVRTIENGGMFAVYQYGTVQLGASSRLVIGEGGEWIAAAAADYIFQPGSSIEIRGTVKVANNVVLTLPPESDVKVYPGSRFELGANSAIVVRGTFHVVGPPGNITWQFGTNAQVKIYGTVDVDPNVVFTIPSTGNFLAYPGARFRMDQNSQITVEGKLHALGSAGNVVEFKPIVPTRSWNGIYATYTQLVQSVDLFLDYVRITGVTRGLHLETPMKAQITNSKITNVSSMAIELVPNAWGSSTDVVFIKNDSINSWANGIVALNTSKFQVEDCRITGSWPGIPTEYAGINLTGSSPKVLRTWVRGFYFGLYALESSAPIFEDGLLGGNNVIRDNNIGVKCKNTSNAVLGLIDGEGDVGGQNCIHDNISLNVNLGGASIVMAQFDYWGTGGDPDPNKLEIDPQSFLEYHPPLSVDPNEGGLGPSFAGGGSKEVIGSPMSPGSELMRRAVGLRSSGRYQEAITLLMSVISDSGETRSVKQWAVSELLSNAMRLQNARLPEYLRQLELSDPELLHVVRGTLPMAYLNDRNVSAAREEWDVNIGRFPGSDLECAALYGKFLVALYHDLDLQQAANLYSLLEARFPRAPQTHLAGSQLEIARSMQNTLFGKPSARFTRSERGSTPSMWVLEQNYPNPFNPSTLIRFHLPEDAHLTLKVHDILGREIAVL